MLRGILCPAVLGWGPLPGLLAPHPPGWAALCAHTGQCPWDLTLGHRGPARLLAGPQPRSDSGWGHGGACVQADGAPPQVCPESPAPKCSVARGPALGPSPVSWAPRAGVAACRSSWMSLPCCAASLPQETVQGPDSCIDPNCPLHRDQRLPGALAKHTLVSWAASLCPFTSSVPTFSWSLDTSMDVSAWHWHKPGGKEGSESWWH